ncbi:transglutaminase family protein [Hydrogenimonas thermophila]|nr:transglutaminase family protein [Hydrogenimonas thermophila]WOE68851.1 transglutaminase family protein [Hydrogenimonas thermophila]WOE71359.1 transglutaminase family protein [Hydrogenimonas thermophila]
MFESKFCKVEYLEKYNAVFCHWKKFCKADDYRIPFEFGLKLIKNKNATAWITDTTNGFENEPEDRKWLLDNFIPKTIDSSCSTIIFIIKNNSPLKNEIDEQTKALSQFFSVKQVENLDILYFKFMTKFLEETNIIDYSNKEIQKLAKSLSSDCKNDIEIAKKCFEYVRDDIRHSGDYKDNITTCKASDVLKYKTGWCYAKSHLLAALLRANNIPTGFCYQRLSCSEYKKDIYCLHGLNAIYLKDYGWYKVDARGNKERVNAQFNPPIEMLAFEIRENEFDLPKIYEEPLEVVVQALEKYKAYDEMINNFPDIELLEIDNKSLKKNI